MLTRRDMLAGSAAVAATVAAPVTAAAGAAPIAVAAVVPPDVGWLVGQEDRQNWQRIYAPTKDAALREWATQYHGSECCEECGRSFVTGEKPGDAGKDDLELAVDDNCDECTGYPLRADRVKQLDPYEGKDVPDKVKYRLGFWIPDCSRCDFSGTDDHGGEASDYGWMMGEHFVCQDCVTLADFAAHHPQEYAERLDELLTDEYGEEINV